MSVYARNILYSMTEEERGVDSGTVLNLLLKVNMQTLAPSPSSPYGSPQPSRIILSTPHQIKQV